MTSAYVRAVQVFTINKCQTCNSEAKRAYETALLQIAKIRRYGTMFNCFPDADARAQAQVGPGLATPLHTIMTALQTCVCMFDTVSLD